jgi:ubiquinone/menaquinone biosynthesis C-methylase UbiE
MRNIDNPSKVLELNRRFHDDVEAATYDDRMGVDFSAGSVAATIDELERVLGHALPSGGIVVDVGAGTGNLAVKLALDGRFDRVVAVDISAGMLASAARSAAVNNVSIETITNDMERLPFADASVDLVVGCAVLHHLPNPVAFLREVRRVLKPGAPCVFIGEPSASGERLTAAVKSPLLAMVKAARLFGLMPQPLWEHEAIDVHTFGPNDVHTLVDGFVEVRFAPEGFVAPVLDQGLLAPLSLIGKRLPGVLKIADVVRAALRRVDAVVAPLAPAGWRASVKFAAAAPAVAIGSACLEASA